MSRLINLDDIWTVSATTAEFRKGYRYAEITLPWTFNRMMLNTGSKGQQERALNIAKGVVAQEVLIRSLRLKGFEIEEEQKSHRDDDLFDLVLPIDGEGVRFDLKSLHFYTDYVPLGRMPLTPDIIIENRGYPGPNWARFFPMMIPHTQIGQDKQVYCFAIAESIDPRKNLFQGRSESRLIAFPYGKHLPFFTYKKLTLEREKVNKGFYVTISYRPDSLFGFHGIEFELIGEWDGEVRRINLMLEAGEYVEDAGPFSCLSAFKVSTQTYETFRGIIEISVSRNDYTEQLLNSSRRNVNTPPTDEFHICPSDFCNLYLPEPYDVHFIGWIEKEDFLQRFTSYPSWVWPDDNNDRFSNQKWTQITENDRNLLNRLGLNDSRLAPDNSIPAGLMKTSGQGGGACCYVFPNVYRRGGVSETNLYVLPKDLRPMNTLKLK